MSRALRLIIAFVLVLAACGGDEGGGDTTAPPAGGDGGDTTAAPTTAAPTTTSTPAVTVGDDFCQFVAEYAENAELNFLATPDDIEAAFAANVAAINQAASIAPNAVQADVDLFAQAFGGLFDFFDEYDWNLLSIPQDAFETDPRIAALDDPALETAGDNIADFCGLPDFADPGFDPGAGGGGGGGGNTGTPAPLPGAELPEGFPAELVPPDGVVLFNVNAGGGVSVTFSAEVPYDEVLQYYKDLVGDPVQELDDPQGAFWVTTWEGQSLTLTLAKFSDTAVEVNVTLV